MGIAELAELWQLREENDKLKRLVADLSLDKHVLQEIVAKSCKAPCTAYTVGADRIPNERAPGLGADGDKPQFGSLSKP
jgi:putative transposase